MNAPSPGMSTDLLSTAGCNPLRSPANKPIASSGVFGSVHAADGLDGGRTAESEATFGAAILAVVDIADDFDCSGPSWSLDAALAEGEVGAAAQYSASCIRLLGEVALDGVKRSARFVVRDAPESSGIGSV